MNITFYDNITGETLLTKRIENEKDLHKQLERLEVQHDTTINFYKI